MGRRRVLLSEGSSLTAREFVTVLGRGGVDVEVMAASRLPIARFSRWCVAAHRAPAPSVDPLAYLAAVDRLMASGRFDALLPTHEQAWLFAVGRDLLPHAAVAVAGVEGFDRLASKLGFAAAADAASIGQPLWQPVIGEADLDAFDFPVWVKTAFSTAGRGVRRVANHRQAVEAWRELAAAGMGEVMIQASAEGRYAQVQGLFDRGRLVAAAASELLAVGAGGSAAARVSVDHPLAVQALARLGQLVGWHGGLGLDYFHLDGVPRFIECNPRISEPGNAAAAGVDFPRLMIALTTREEALPQQPVLARAGIRTRSTMAIALGAAETRGTRRAILLAIARAVSLDGGSTGGSREVLTPVLTDPASLLPFAVATGTVLARPANVARLAGDAVARYGLTSEAIERVRRATRS